MSEHSAQNRAQLQSTRIDDPTMESSQETAQQREEDEDIRMMQDDVMGCHGTRSSLKALIRLFLKHHAKADQATIEVCVSESTVLLQYCSLLKLCTSICRNHCYCAENNPLHNELAVVTALDQWLLLQNEKIASIYCTPDQPSEVMCACMIKLSNK